MDDPVISVVIPSRDRPRILEATLRSVLAQTHSNWEAIVVDDGSVEPLEPSLSADPRVRVIRHERSLGVAAARNRGVAEAGGAWIAFLDDDDLWAPTKLERQLEIAQSTEAAFAYTGVVLFEDATSEIVRREPAPAAERLGDLLRFTSTIPAGASNVLVRAEVLRRVGCFDSCFTHFADWDLWIRLAAQHRGAAVSDFLVAYRLHGTSMHRTSGGVLRELRVLDRKHHGGDFNPRPRFHMYLWVAEGHRAAHRRTMAIATRGLGAMRCGLPREIVRAPKAVLAPRRPSGDGVDSIPWLAEALGAR